MTRIAPIPFRAVRVAAFLVSVSWLWQVPAQEWTRFRGPNGSGISHVKTIPSKWTDTDFNWRIKLPGTGHSSPVLWGNKIFVTSCDEESGEFIVSCLGTDDGGTLWTKRYPFTIFGRHNLNTHASSTPTVDAERVYICRTEPQQITISALDHSGKQVWERQLGAFDSNHGSGASPVLCEDMLIFANEQGGPSFLIALNAKDGRTRWQVPRESGSGGYSTPCVYQKDAQTSWLVFNSQEHGISAVSPTDGTIVWQFAKAFDKRSVSSPVVAGDLIIGSCGSGGGGNYVVAVRPGSTQKAAQRAYEVRRSAPYVPTSLCVGEWLYLWSDGGIVSRVYAPTGEVKWQERVGGNFYGSPVWVEGRLFCLSTTGEVVVVADSEQFEVIARNPLNETTHSTPAIAGGRMYVRTSQHLISIGGTSATP